MHTHNDTVVLTATDLVNFLGCQHASHLNRRFLDKAARDAKPKSEEDPFLKLLQEKGIEHERAYLKSLTADGLKVVDLEANGSLGNKILTTRAAMRAGADIIYQGALETERWHGYADFLIRVPAASRLGPFSYEVMDTKLSRTPKPSGRLAEIVGKVPQLVG